MLTKSLATVGCREFGVSSIQVLFKISKGISTNIRVCIFCLKREN